MTRWDRDAIDAWNALSEKDKRIIAARWAAVSDSSRFTVKDYTLACRRLREATAAKSPCTPRRLS